MQCLSFNVTFIVHVLISRPGAASLWDFDSNVCVRSCVHLCVCVRRGISDGIGKVCVVFWSASGMTIEVVGIKNWS